MKVSILQHSAFIFPPFKTQLRISHLVSHYPIHLFFGQRIQKPKERSSKLAKIAVIWQKSHTQRLWSSVSSFIFQFCVLLLCVKEVPSFPPKSCSLTLLPLCAHSAVPNSLQPHGLQPTQVLCPWNFPGKDTGVVCHFLLQKYKHRFNRDCTDCPVVKTWPSNAGVQVPPMRLKD